MDLFEKLATDSAAVGYPGLTKEDFDTEMDKASETATVVIGDPVTLLLDLDDVQSELRFERLLPRARSLFGVYELDRWTSKSGDGTHVKLALPANRSLEFRVAMQAILGSDPLRELLTLARAENGIEEPSRLFKPRQDA